MNLNHSHTYNCNKKENILVPKEKVTHQKNEIAFILQLRVRLHRCDCFRFKITLINALINGNIPFIIYLDVKIIEAKK